MALIVLNVLFSPVAVVLLLTAGLYEEVSGALPADNPYRRVRTLQHPSVATENRPDLPQVPSWAG